MLISWKLPVAKSESIVFWQKPQSFIIYRWWLLFMHTTHIWHLRLDIYALTDGASCLTLKEKKTPSHILGHSASLDKTQRVQRIRTCFNHPGSTPWIFCAVNCIDVLDTLRTPPHYLLCGIKEQLFCLKHSTGTEVMWFHPVLTYGKGLSFQY